MCDDTQPVCVQRQLDASEKRFSEALQNVNQDHVEKLIPLVLEGNPLARECMLNRVTCDQLFGVLQPVASQYHDNSDTLVNFMNYFFVIQKVEQMVSCTDYTFPVESSPFCMLQWVANKGFYYVWGVFVQLLKNPSPDIFTCIKMVGYNLCL